MLAACDQPVTPVLTTGPQATSTAVPTKTSTPKNLSPTSSPPLPTATRSPSSALGVSKDRLRGQVIQAWYVPSEPALFGGSKDPFPTQVEDFNRTNPWGIHVDLTPFEDYTALFEQIDAEMYGTLPDLITGYNYQAFRLYLSTQKLVDLNPYILDPQWGLSDQEIIDFFPIFWSQDISGEKRVGVPLYRSAQVMFYNQSLAKELGFQNPPESTSQFKAQACAAARARQKTPIPQESGQAGGWAITTDVPTVVSWFSAFGVAVEADKGNSYSFDNPQAQRLFSFLRDLYDGGCAWQPESSYPNEDLAARRALFISGSVTGLPFQARAFQVAKNTDRWTAIPFPSFQGKPVVDVYGPSLYVLDSTPEKRLAAWLLVKALLSPQNQAAWVDSLGSFPVRASAETYLEAFEKDHPQWQAAFKLLPYAHTEPGDPSWGSVRWVVRDAYAQLFSPTFLPGQIPDVLKRLDATLKDLESQIR